LVHFFIQRHDIKKLINRLVVSEGALCYENGNVCKDRIAEKRPRLQAFMQRML
jgi:hypothetical protein